MALAQGRDIAFCATFVFALVAAFCCSASATVWTVGDAKGWNVSVDYTAWASGKTFVVGDVLFFPYEIGRHTVVVVNKTEYDSCSILLSDPTETNGNTSIALNKTGSHYYLCSFPNHCALGMKLAVNVVSAAAPAPGSTSPSPSPAPVPAPVTAPTPSPTSTATPTPSPASTATPTPSSASSPTPASSPALAPTGATTPSPASTTTPPSAPASSPTGTTTPATSPPSPPGATPTSAPPSSAPRVQAAIGGAAVLWTLVGSSLLIL